MSYKLISREGAVLGSFTVAPLDIPDGTRLSYRKLVPNVVGPAVRIRFRDTDGWTEPVNDATWVCANGTWPENIETVIRQLMSHLGEVNIGPPVLPGLPELTTPWERFMFLWDYVFKERTT